MIDTTAEHRGGELIGEKMTDVEKLAHFRNKYEKVSKMLNEKLTHAYLDKREAILEVDVEFSDLDAERNLEDKLFDQTFLNEDAGVIDDEWFAQAKTVDELERKMVERSAHPDAVEVRKVDALREYADYLEDKITKLRIAEIKQ